MTIKVNATFNKSKDTSYEVNVDIDDLIEALIASDSFGDLATAIDAELNS